MYGLPKVHKNNVPVRPILSMTGSAQHKLAKWLNTVLEPVRLLYSKHCLRDSFSFVQQIQSFDHQSKPVFLSSFDISSLFTNIPLVETIDICADALYGDDLLDPPPFPRDIFIELMKLATCSVEFSFNNVMYRQIDGVAMGSPLGPTLANIFVGFNESKLPSRSVTPLMYQRYVDDIFAIFETEHDCDLFFSSLNTIHPSLHFTVERESNNSLPFLDVLVEKRDHRFFTSVYRKPTFTGQYVRWNSFCPKKRKLNLIGTLVHRALVICSPNKLPGELDNIRNILVDNGYPIDIVNSTIDRKIKRFHTPATYGPNKCPVYIHLPWLGTVSNRFEKQISSALNRCYFAVKPCVLFNTRKMLLAIHKDVLPTLQQSHIIYQFSCRCDSRYIGRTSQRLQDRVKQHVPKSIRFPPPSQSTSDPVNHSYNETVATSSAIGQHLLHNPVCAEHYNDSMFSVISKGRSTFHLQTLESTIIKLSKPNLCRQKEFVYSLQIVH